MDVCLETSSARHAQHLSNVTESSISTAIVDPPTFAKSSLNGGDGDVARPKDDKAPSRPSPELVGDSKAVPADDNVSPDMPTGSADEDGSSGAMCRICHDGHQEKNPLLSLCRCSGTMGFMHASCLERWLNDRNVDICEFCGQRFPVEVERISALRFFHYLSQGNGGLWPALLCDLLVLVLLIMFTPPSEEESCPVPSSLPCDTESSIFSVVHDQPAFENSSQKGGDDGATRSQDNRAPSPPAPALVSDSEDEPANDNVSRDTPSGSSNEDGSGGPVCRICHEGDQEEPLVSLCRCSGTMGFVHVSCLEQWINQKNVDFCEICGQRFAMAARRSDVIRFIRRFCLNSTALEFEICECQKLCDATLGPPFLTCWKHGAYNESFSSLPSKEPGFFQPADKVKSFIDSGPKLYVLTNFP
ncbi:hypothetical protein MTO96_013253 [Rhipicephalus appendiculatus]